METIALISTRAKTNQLKKSYFNWKKITTESHNETVRFLQKLQNESKTILLLAQKTSQRKWNTIAHNRSEMCRNGKQNRKPVFISRYNFPEKEN